MGICLPIAVSLAGIFAGTRQRDRRIMRGLPTAGKGTHEQVFR